MLSIFFIGIALSMDAFSVVLTLGLQQITKKKLYLIPIVISVFHFVMPLLGNLLGSYILGILSFNSRIFLILIFLYLIITIILDKNSDDKKNIASIFNIIILSFGVSIDSFSVGLGLSAITDNYIAASSIFSLCAGTITYMGLIIGKYTSRFLSSKAELVGIFILIALVIVNICKLF